MERLERIHMTTDTIEIIDANELAKRLAVPSSWIRQQARSRAADPIPCLKLGKYRRFEWGSKALAAWMSRRR